MRKISIIKFSFENRLHWQLEVKNICKNDYFRLRVCLRTNKTVKRNSLYVLDYCGKCVSHEKMQYKYGKNCYLNGQADPGNQRPNKWSSTVHVEV
jgi:hypothetical protein